MVEAVEIKWRTDFLLYVQQVNSGYSPNKPCRVVLVGQGLVVIYAWPVRDPAVIHHGWR